MFLLRGIKRRAVGQRGSRRPALSCRAWGAPLCLHARGLGSSSHVNAPVPPRARTSTSPITPQHCRAGGFLRHVCVRHAGSRALSLSKGRKTHRNQKKRKRTHTHTHARTYTQINLNQRTHPHRFRCLHTQPYTRLQMNAHAYTTTPVHTHTHTRGPWLRMPDRTHRKPGRAVPGPIAEREIHVPRGRVAWRGGNTTRTRLR